MRRALFLAGALVTACGDGRPDIVPTPLVGLTVEGPTAISLGDSARYRAIHREYSTGSTRDVTDEAQWTSSNPAVLSIDRGMASGLVFGEAHLRAHFEGLQSAPVPVLVWVDYSGTYTLTLGGGVCTNAGSRPTASTLRTYTALVVHNASTLDVRLSGASFETGDSFPGQVRAAGVTFTLIPGSIDWAQVTERLPDGTWLEIGGAAVTTPSPSGLSGTFEGTFTQWTYDASAGYQIVGTCQSDAHQFTLAR